jgi:hypothetical protein
MKWKFMLEDDGIIERKITLERFREKRGIELLCVRKKDWLF